MKLRAPRCRDAVLVTSSSARQLSQSAPAPPPPSAAPQALPARRSPASSSAFLAVPMISHSVRHRLHLVDARVPRHQQEECEIDRGEDARENHVQAFSRLQAKISERDEGYGEEAERSS